MWSTWFQLAMLLRRHSTFANHGVTVKDEPKQPMQAPAKVITVAQPLGQKKHLLPHQPSSRPTDSFQRPTPAQLFHITTRIIGLAATIFYHSTVESGVYSVRTLFGISQYIDDYGGGYRAEYIASHVGTTTMKESPLFTQVLGCDSTPRQETIYLHSTTNGTFTKCENMADMSQWLYSNEFIRLHWDDLVAQTSYNLTFLDESELIAPIVDCSSTSIRASDITSAQMFYLLRKKSDPASVFIVVASFSTQDYRAPEQFQKGPAIYVSLVVIDDMRATKLNYYLVLSMSYPFEGPHYSVYTLQGYSNKGYVILENVPEDPTTVYKRVLYTSNRSGYYFQSEESQANFRSTYLTFYDDPVLALTKWRWSGYTAMRNSRGWARRVHFILP